MRSILLLLSFSFIFCACHITTNSERITGNGKTATEQRTASDFTGIELSGPYDVFLQQGPTYAIKIEGDENLIKYMETRISGNTLHIHPRDGYNLRSKTGIKIYITAPGVTRFAIAGSGSIKSNSKITASSDVDIQIGGSGNVTIDVDAPQVSAEIGGSGNVTVKGRTRDFDAEVAGSGEIHGFELLSENTRVQIAGSGDAEVFASKKLDISIAGSGDVRYRGTPAIKQSIAGSGDIRHAP